MKVLVDCKDGYMMKPTNNLRLVNHTKYINDDGTRVYVGEQRLVLQQWWQNNGVDGEWRNVPVVDQDRLPPVPVDAQGNVRPFGE